MKIKKHERKPDERKRRDNEIMRENYGRGRREEEKEKQGEKKGRGKHKGRKRDVLQESYGNEGKATKSADLLN